MRMTVKPRMGRPPLPESDRRRVVGISLSPAAIEALRELARVRGMSQGEIMGKLILGAFARERRKTPKD